MIHRIFALLFLFAGKCTAEAQVKHLSTIVNPTGTYTINGKPLRAETDSKGYFGHIEVKLLNNKKVVIALFVCKGAPSFNSGSFIDTIRYSNHTAIYKSAESDTSCRIIFKFSERGVGVTQNQANLNFGCGFGHAVFADGFYKRISHKMPKIDPDEYQ